MKNSHQRFCKRSFPAAGLMLAVAVPSFAQQHEHDPRLPGAQSAPRATAADTRVAVAFPEPMKAHALANMRDHLQAIGEIQGHLARRDADRAAEVAEKRLGMSSLESHGAHDVAKFMPQGMQDAGTA
ncbi:MAG: hypothetical protein ABI831_11025, partial [Betaproteobacteria bacterium]